jgi:hypothetical protein
MYVWLQGTNHLQNATHQHLPASTPETAGCAVAMLCWQHQGYGLRSEDCACSRGAFVYWQDGASEASTCLLSRVHMPDGTSVSDSRTISEAWYTIHMVTVLLAAGGLTIARQWQSLGTTCVRGACVAMYTVYIVTVWSRGMRMPGVSGPLGPCLCTPYTTLVSQGRG